MSRVRQTLRVKVPVLCATIAAGRLSVDMTGKTLAVTTLRASALRLPTPADRPLYVLTLTEG